MEEQKYFPACFILGNISGEQHSLLTRPAIRAACRTLSNSRAAGPRSGVRGLRREPGSSPGSSSRVPSLGWLIWRAGHPGEQVLGTRRPRGPGRVACVRRAGLRGAGSLTYRAGARGRPGVTVARGGGRGGGAGRGRASSAKGCSARRAPPAPSPQRRPAQQPSRAEPLLSVRRRQARSQTCPAAPRGGGRARARQREGVEHPLAGQSPCGRPAPRQQAPPTTESRPRRSGC